MKNPSNSAAFSHPGLADLPALHAAVCEAVKQAGAMLEAEFSRARGPRGSYSKAPVDVEIEEFLHHTLTTLLPVPFRAEEKHDITPDAGGTLWLVDPHDGTSAFLGGFRGSAVSVALLHQCVPVLGVVYAPSSPDRGPDLISWAEGLPALLRNGVPVAGQPGNPGTLLLAHHYAPTKLAEWHGRAAPGQFFAMPSIAYRLARVACGDAAATCSLGGTQDWDYAAGHALLRGAGGVLVNARGEPVEYTPRGESFTSELFGGMPEAVEQLRQRVAGGGNRSAVASATSVANSGRTVPTVSSREYTEHQTTALARPHPRGEWPRVAEGKALDRAVGCLLGQAIGDSLGSLVEFRSATDIAKEYPAGVRELRSGVGTWRLLAGQPTDDTELALALARTLVHQRGFAPDAIATAYGRWFRDGWDIGTTTRQAFSELKEGTQGTAAVARRNANRVSQSNGATMRAAPLAIAATNADQAAAWAAEDALLSHPNPVCVVANAAYVVALYAGIAGDTPQEMHAAAMRAARETGNALEEGGIVGTAEAVQAVVTRLEAAARGELPEDFMRQMGWVLTALQAAFHALLHAPSAAEGLVQVVGCGGDTDTNGAIAGALLGAAYGRQAWPARWTTQVLACRPVHGTLSNRWAQGAAYLPPPQTTLASLSPSPPTHASTSPLSPPPLT